MKIMFFVKFGDRQIQIEDEVANQAEAWRVVASWDALPQTGPDGQTDLKFSYRTPQGNEYFAIECPSAGKEFKFGQLREGKGKLFPKHWAPILHGLEDFDEEPVSKPEPSRSTPNPRSSSAALPANVTDIDATKYFSFQREHNIDFRRAEEIRTDCTVGGKVYWERAFVELRKLVDAPAVKFTPGQIKLNEIFAALRKLGVADAALVAKLSKVCDGLCEIESLDETQTAKALAVFNRDLQTKQAELRAKKSA